MRYIRQLFFAVFSLLLAFIGGSSVRAAQNIRITSEIIRIDSPIPGLRLGLHHNFRKSARPPSRQIVLFAEGSAVPTAGNAGFKINGVSWMDSLALSGFDVWSLDYLGYGESSRYRETDLQSPPGRARDCASQLANAVKFILAKRGVAKLSIIGDSFGSLVAGIYASRSPQSVDKLILFAPVTPVAEAKPNQPLSSVSQFDIVTPADLWQLYSTWLPKGEHAGVDRNFFLATWGSKYLDTDPTSRQRRPPSVMVPAGPDLDTADIQRGQFPYNPGLITKPTLIIFGEWDAVATEEGGKRLFDLLTGTRNKRRIVIGKGTHVLQLESSRRILYQEVVSFLQLD
ncbi:MAG TPA: alpha/beta fold hydrolase [Pyrinomonadaceae bacterium]